MEFCQKKPIKCLALSFSNCLDGANKPGGQRVNKWVRSVWILDPFIRMIETKNKSRRSKLNCITCQRRQKQKMDSDLYTSILSDHIQINAIKLITRPSQCRCILTANIPTQRPSTGEWMDTQYSAFHCCIPGCKMLCKYIFGPYFKPLSSHRWIKLWESVHTNVWAIGRHHAGFPLAEPEHAEHSG